MKAIIVAAVVLMTSVVSVHAVDVVLDSMTGTISTQANAQGFDYQYDLGNVAIDVDDYLPYTVRIRGQVTNLYSYTEGTGMWRGSWNFIGLMDQDYVQGGLAPFLGQSLTTARELAGDYVMAHPGDTNYGYGDMQRGINANACIDIWRDSRYTPEYTRVAAEDHSFSGGPTGGAPHKQDIPGSIAERDVYFEVEYLWEDSPWDGWNRKFVVRFRAQETDPWIESSILNAGARNTYDLLEPLGTGAELEDWSAVVMAVKSGNSLPVADDPGGLGFDYDVELVVADVLAGDVNMDGVTDGRDYDLCQANQGMLDPSFMDGDADRDGDVDGDDLALIYGQRPVACGALGTAFLAADVNADCAVDLMDFQDLALEWLFCNDPCDVGCVDTW